jgi:trehalose-6-phosphatase
MIQLGMYEAMGGWEYINESPARLQAVTADDIRRVVGAYLTTSNSAVAVYTRKAGAAAEDPELAAMDDETRARVRAMLAQIKKRANPEQLRTMVAQMEGMIALVPAEDRPATDYVLKKMKEHLAELEAAADN